LASTKIASAITVRFAAVVCWLAIWLVWVITAMANSLTGVLLKVRLLQTNLSQGPFHSIKARYNKQVNRNNRAIVLFSFGIINKFLEYRLSHFVSFNFVKYGKEGVWLAV
jgi:hypothetical protein